MIAEKKHIQEKDPLVDMGMNLVVARKVKGISQMELVEEAKEIIPNFNQDKLSKMERKKSYPYELAHQLSDILGVSYEFLTQGIMEKIVTSYTLENNPQTNTNTDGIQEAVQGVIESENSGNITNHYNYPPEYMKELVDKLIETTTNFVKAEAEKEALIQEVKELKKKLLALEK